MTNYLFLDVESVGLCGALMRIQYALNDGPIVFLDYPFDDTDANQALLAHLYDPNVLLVAYNAGFDVFYLYKWLHKSICGYELNSPQRPVKPFACNVLDLQIPCLLHGPFKNFAFSI